MSRTPVAADAVLVPGETVIRIAGTTVTGKVTHDMTNPLDEEGRRSYWVTWSDGEQSTERTPFTDLEYA